MKKLLFSFITITLSFIAVSQTVLYQDDFETNGTFIMASTSVNQWTINADYSGLVLPPVPSQPVGISNPNGNYLHPVSISLQSLVPQSNYELPGTQQMLAVMTGNVNLTNYENTEISFWRTGGFEGLKVVYSIAGGPWQDAYTVTGNPTSWQQETFSLPIADGENDVSIGFEFDETTALDPAPNHYHSIDDLTISATLVGGTTDEITASVTNLEYCNGDLISVEYDVTTGNINAGNEFTLELSDNTGSFASPTVIQTVSSTNLSGLISGTLPTLPPVGLGTNFRVRVNSSNDVIVGTANVDDITISDVPTADFNATTVCQGLATEFTDASTSGVTIANWSWDFGNGNSSSDQNPTENFTSDGIYNVELTIEDANGCSSSQVNNVEVLETPTAQFTATEVCFGNTTVFTDVSSPSSGSNIISWVWDFDNGTNSTMQNPNTSYTSPGTYNVSLTVFDDNCQNQVTNPVTVLTLPTVAFTATEVCEGEETVFTDQSTSQSGSPLIAFNWDFDDGNNSTVQNTTHTFASVGAYDVELEVEDDNGCTNLATNIVTVNAVPDTPTISILANGDLEATNTSANDFEWYLDGTLIPGENSALITPTQSGDYTVIAVNGDCASEISASENIDIANISIFENETFSLYPNPVTNQLQLSYNESVITSIELVDVTGQLVQNMTSGKTSIDMSGLQTGVYFVKFIGSNNLNVLKVVKR